MAKILFGGPQKEEGKKPSPVHDDLVARLRAEGHKVDYFTEGLSMAGGLHIHAMKYLRAKVGLRTKVYDLVLYDTGLFFGPAELSVRAKEFEEIVVGYLKAAKTPVIVLAQQEMAGLIGDAVEKAGFKQINQPYNIEFVVNEVSSSLKCNRK